MCMIVHMPKDIWFHEPVNNCCEVANESLPQHATSEILMQGKHFLFVVSLVFSPQL